MKTIITLLFVLTALPVLALDLSPFVGASTVDTVGNAESKMLRAGATVQITNGLAIAAQYEKQESSDPNIDVLTTKTLPDGSVVPDQTRSTSYDVGEVYRADVRLGRGTSSGNTSTMFYIAPTYSLVDFENGAEEEGFGGAAGFIGRSGALFLNAEYFYLNDDYRGVGINLGFNIN